MCFFPEMELYKIKHHDQLNRGTYVVVGSYASGDKDVATSLHVMPLHGRLSSSSESIISLPYYFLLEPKTRCDHAEYVELTPALLPEF